MDSSLAPARAKWDPQGATLSPFYFGILIGIIEKIIEDQGGEDGKEKEKKRGRREESLWALLFFDNKKMVGEVENNEGMQRLQMEPK